MKLHYYLETESLYIELSEKAAADSREVAPGVVIDFDADGALIGIDVDRASAHVDLSRLEGAGLPLRSFSLTQP